MNKERLIEILAEVSQLKTETIESGINERVNKFPLRYVDALAAMTRAVEEETARLRERVVSLEDELFEKDNNPNYKSDLARLRECEAIVRELAGTDFSDDLSMQDIRDLSRQWVRENPE